VNLRVSARLTLLLSNSGTRFSIIRTNEIDVFSSHHQFNDQIFGTILKT